MSDATLRELARRVRDGDATARAPLAQALLRAGASIEPLWSDGSVIDGGVSGAPLETRAVAALVEDLVHLDSTKALAHPAIQNGVTVRLARYGERWLVARAVKARLELRVVENGRGQDWRDRPGWWRTDREIRGERIDVATRRLVPVAAELFRSFGVAFPHDLQGSVLLAETTSPRGVSLAVRTTTWQHSGATVVLEETCDGRDTHDLEAWSRGRSRARIGGLPGGVEIALASTATEATSFKLATFRGPTGAIAPVLEAWRGLVGPESQP